MQARQVVERMIGALKNTFRCLNRERALKYHPRTAGKIINAACVVYNIMRNNGLPIAEVMDDAAPSNVAAEILPTQYFQLGTAKRNQIAQLLAQ